MLTLGHSPAGFGGVPSSFAVPGLVPQITALKFVDGIGLLVAGTSHGLVQLWRTRPSDIAGTLAGIFRLPQSAAVMSLAVAHGPPLATEDFGAVNKPSGAGSSEGEKARKETKEGEKAKQTEAMKDADVRGNAKTTAVPKDEEEQPREDRPKTTQHKGAEKEKGLDRGQDDGEAEGSSQGGSGKGKKKGALYIAVCDDFGRGHYYTIKHEALRRANVAMVSAGAASWTCRPLGLTIFPSIFVPLLRVRVLLFSLCPCWSIAH